MDRLLRGFDLLAEVVVDIAVVLGETIGGIARSTRASTSPSSSGSCGEAPPFLSSIVGDLEWGAEEAAARANDWEFFDETLRATTDGGAR